ncbi:type II toxin-antitoxin system CcdA family antitoxin [Pectobacterium polaris]|nr:type II toxin-antitoxin system CcdA family antitoxin [Pectobacterium polaris]
MLSYTSHHSDQVNDVIGEEARRIKAEERKKENREGMENVARFIAKHGSFADENRNW